MHDFEVITQSKGEGTDSLNDQSNAEPSWLMAFVSKVADADHTCSHREIKHSNDHASSKAGETVVLLSGREHN